MLYFICFSKIEIHFFQPCLVWPSKHNNNKKQNSYNVTSVKTIDAELRWWTEWPNYREQKTDFRSVNIYIDTIDNLFCFCFVRILDNMMIKLWLRVQVLLVHIGTHQVVIRKIFLFQNHRLSLSLNKQKEKKKIFSIETYRSRIIKEKKFNWTGNELDFFSRKWIYFIFKKRRQSLSICVMFVTSLI